MHVIVAHCKCNPLQLFSGREYSSVGKVMISNEINFFFISSEDVGILFSSSIIRCRICNKTCCVSSQIAYLLYSYFRMSFCNMIWCAVHSNAFFVSNKQINLNHGQNVYSLHKTQQYFVKRFLQILNTIFCNGIDKGAQMPCKK